MNKKLAIVLATAACTLAAGAAHAGNVHWSVGISVPNVQTVISSGPVYVPAPVYAPPPVVYHPAPVYYQPAPVYYRPAPVYLPPPVVVVPRPGGWWQRGWHDRHDHDGRNVRYDRRDWDRDDHRGGRRW